MLKKFVFILWSVLIMTESAANSANAADAENTLYLDLAQGRVVIEMYPDVAPLHVNRIQTLTREGFYDGEG